MSYLEHPSDYKELKKAIEDFQLGENALFADKEVFQVPLVALRRIPQRSDVYAVKPHQLEYKVDQLAGQFVELSLFVKKKFEKGGNAFMVD